MLLGRALFFSFKQVIRTLLEKTPGPTQPQVNPGELEKQNKTKNQTNSNITFLSQLPHCTHQGKAKFMFLVTQ